MSKIQKVFVYGTLKRGEPNHHWLNKFETGIAKFVCEAQTVTKYPLIIATKYNIPYLLHSPGMGHNVKGEVYEVDDRTLAQLDILEDHPNYYTRELDILSTLVGEKSEFKAWIYFIKTFRPELLKKLMLESYNNCGEHGLKYMERYLRDDTYDYINEIILKAK